MKLALIKTPETLPEGQVAHSVKGEIVEPIANVECRLFLGAHFEMRDDLAYVALNDGLLIHKSLLREGMTDSTPLIPVFHIVWDILQRHRLAHSNRSCVQSGLRHSIFALAETVDVVERLRGVEGQLIRGQCG